MGIFGNMFDFNNNGKLDPAEQGMEFAFLDCITNKEQDEFDDLELDEMFEDD